MPDCKYSIHSGDEFNGDSCYQVLKGPDGFECWLTEPEDRSFYRDLAPLIERLEMLEAKCKDQNDRAR